MTRIPLESRLLPLVRRKRVARFWLRLALCWLIGCLAGLGFMIWAAFSGWLPTLILPTIVIASGVAAGVVWNRYRRSSDDLHRCVREIELRHPELNGRLLTAVEQQPDERGQFSYLQHRLFEEALAHDRLLNWDAALPVSRIGFLKLVHALTFAVFLVTCLRLGTLQKEGFGGAVIAGGIAITPGDTSLERGDRLVVMVQFNARAPSNVDLIVRQEDKSAQRVPLVRRLDDPIFGGSIDEVTDDLTYSVEYAGRSSRDFEVTVFDYPRLERADAELIYPDYTGLPPKRIEDTRHLTAVDGTRLDLRLQLNKPVADARLLPKSEGSEPVLLATKSARSEVHLTNFVLSATERYALQLVDADGRTNRQVALFVFNVHSNRVPEMQIASPRGDIRPSPLEEVSYQGTVFDDFGVLAYGLAYIIGGQEIHTVELGRQVPGKEKHSYEHVLPFEDLGVRSGDLVSWFFWSEDIGPDGEIRRTTSDLYFAEVRPFEEIFRQGQPQVGQMDAQQQQMGERGGGQAARLTELQQQIIHATWKLQREHGSSTSHRATPPQSSLNAWDSRVWEPLHIQSPESATPSGRQPLNGFLREMLDSSVQLFRVGPQFFGQTAETERGDVLREQRGASTRQRANPSSRTLLFGRDVQVVIDAQRDALRQAQEARQRQEDPRQIVMWDDAIQQMESALEQLSKATNSPSVLEAALSAQQAAYQRLLRLQEREYSVSRNRNQNNSGRQRQVQRQLDQLDLTSEENRYETERLAQAPQSAEQREQLQVMSRLAELARRQQDINERLQELQTALQAAQTEKARRQLRRELKRLQDEQQQMVSDLDELRQRMDSQDNQSRLAEQREQLEQTRESLQRAAEAAEQGAVSQALAAGTRAQREMQEIREELRNQSAGAFAEDMRRMRSDARELSRRQAALQDQIEGLDTTTGKSLTDSKQTAEVRERFREQRERLTNLVERATEVSQLAEPAEPLMSSTLYDTLREYGQDDLGAVKQVQEDLLANGIFQLYERLKRIAQQSDAKTLDMTSEVLREGYLELAKETGQRALQDIDDLARGIERAAELVLGDDTEALRLARQQLEELTDQLEQEMSRATSGGTNTQGVVPDGSDGQEASRSQGGQPVARDSESVKDTPQTDATPQNGDRRSTTESQAGQLADENGRQPGQDETDRTRSGEGSGERQEPDTDMARARNSDEASGPAGFDIDQFLGGAQGGGGPRSGPITGNDFGPWSDRLREVEELVDLPDLRNELTRARERVRQLRRNYTRDQQKPDWAQVNLEIVQPLVEVHSRIGEELARRQSRESLVPIDRDPVPERYSELVRRYYEELGKDND